MIERLVGNFVKKYGHTALIDVQGVGYGVEMPERLLLALEAGLSSQVNAGGNGREDDVAARSPRRGFEAPKAEVWIHTHVREDALKLFGFMTFEERELFSLLLSVSGVGPKIALAVINEFTVQTLMEAVLTEDHKTLESVPGIGPRQSKKLLLELKPKMEKLTWTALADQSVPVGGGKGLFAGASGKAKATQRALVLDVQSALINLGYKEKEIQRHLRGLNLSEDATVEDTLRVMLLRLSGHDTDQGSLENELF